MSRFVRLFLFVLLMIAVPMVAFAGPYDVPAKIPDTGQTLCYDSVGNEISCPGTGQDGEFSINTMSFTSLGGGTMVQDNVTGLIWEVKENKDGNPDPVNPHDADNTYTWYDSNDATNGGNPGTPGDGTDTEDFINALNSAAFGGYTDWRLPSREELRSIMDYSIPRSGPTIDTSYFPNTVLSAYWSSITSGSNMDYVWYERFGYGDDFDINYTKSGSRYVRAVRGGQSATTTCFIDNGDNTVTDTRTGLIWEQKTDANKNTTYTWQEALDYCKDLNNNIFADQNDWRLPTIKELASLVDLSQSYPSIDPIFKNYTIPRLYWSSTTSADNAYEGDLVYFDKGSVHFTDKSYSHYVRAVRGGQGGSFDNLPIYRAGSVDPAQGSSGDNFTFTCTWEDPNGDSVVDVKLRYRMQGSVDWTEYADTLAFVNGTNPPQFTTTIPITGDPNTYEYQFQASQVDAADPAGPRTGTTGWKGEETFLIVGAPEPPDPPTLTATGPHSISVRWSQRTDAANYILYRSDPQTEYSDRVYIGPALGFDDSGDHLLPETEYTYKLSVQNAAGTSAPSAVVSASTLSPTESAPLPDLRPIGLTVSKNDFTTGEEQTIEVSIDNVGEQDAAPYKAQLYLSKNGEQISGLDHFLGNAIEITNHIKDKVTTVAHKFTIPELTDGTYFLGLLVDTDNSVDEGSGANNYQLTETRINVTRNTGDINLPDLTGTVNSDIKVWFVGEDAEIRLTVNNASSGVAGSHTCRFYLSEDTNITKDDIPIGDVLMGSIDSSQTRREKVTLPENVPGGLYHIGALIDVDQEVEERSEWNNDCFVQNQVEVNSSQYVTISGQITDMNNIKDFVPQPLYFYHLKGFPNTEIDGYGRYSIKVPYGWSGTLEPDLPYYRFVPKSRSYNNVTADKYGDDYNSFSIKQTLKDINSKIGLLPMNPWEEITKRLGLEDAAGVVSDVKDIYLLFKDDGEEDIKSYFELMEILAGSVGGPFGLVAKGYIHILKETLDQISWIVQAQTEKILWGNLGMSSDQLQFLVKFYHDGWILNNDIDPDMFKPMLKKAMVHLYDWDYEPKLRQTIDLNIIKEYIWPWEEYMPLKMSSTFDMNIISSPTWHTYIPPERRRLFLELQWCKNKYSDCGENGVYSMIFPFTMLQPRPNWPAHWLVKLETDKVLGWGSPVYLDAKLNTGSKRRSISQKNSRALDGSNTIEDCIKYKLGFSQTDTLTQAQADTVETIDCSWMDIGSIQNIGMFRNLKIVNLSNNSITDVSPLAELAHLTYVDLSQNKISDVSSLAMARSKDVTINMAGNCVQDFTTVDQNLLNTITFEGEDEQRSDCAKVENFLNNFKVTSKNFQEKSITYEYNCYSNQATEGSIDFGDGETAAVTCDGETYTLSHTYAGTGPYNAVFGLSGVETQLEVEVVNLLDILVILKTLVGIEDYRIENISDIDGSGNIDLMEAIYGIQALAGIR